MIRPSHIWRNLRTNRKTKIATNVILVWLFIAFLHPFIANDKAIIAKSENGITSPVILQLIQPSNIKQVNYEWQLMPMIPYSSQSIDLSNANYISPFGKQQVSSFTKRHWLGTDKLGRDTLAGLVEGSFFALLIGFGSSLLSVILGVCIGIAAGYWGNTHLKFNSIQLSLALICLVLLLYTISYGFFFGYNWNYLLELIPFSGIIGLWWFTHKFAGRLDQKPWAIPLDNIVLRVLEIFKSIPVLFFILSFLVLFSQANVYTIILIVGLVSWPISCRYTRAEVKRIAAEDFILSAKVLGLPDLQILLRHVLPHAVSPALIVFSFGISSAVVLEATLSFLGLGLSVEQVTWGSMLSEVRTNFKAWWLVLFPGIMLFFVVSSMNTISDGINQYLKNQSA